MLFVSATFYRCWHRLSEFSTLSCRQLTRQKMRKCSKLLNEWSMQLVEEFCWHKFVVFPTNCWCLCEKHKTNRGFHCMRWERMVALHKPNMLHRRTWFCERVKSNFYHINVAHRLTQKLWFYHAFYPVRYSSSPFRRLMIVLQTLTHDNINLSTLSLWKVLRNLQPTQYMCVVGISGYYVERSKSIRDLTSRC